MHFGIHVPFGAGPPALADRLDAKNGSSPCRDIGTSFIYVFPAVFAETPSDEDIIGGVSLVIWTITTLCLVKYALLVLRADDNGQG